MILLSKPMPMKKVYVVFPKEYGGKVGSLLQEAGVVHVAQSEQVKVVEEYETLLKVREELMSLISKVRGLRVEAELRALEAASLTVEKVRAEVASLATSVGRVESQVSRLREECEKLSLFGKVLSAIPSDIEPKALYYEGKRLSSILLVCKREAVEALRKQPYVKALSEYSVDEETRAALVFLESEALGQVLEFARLHGVHYPSGPLLRYIAESRSMSELRATVASELAKMQGIIRSLEADIEKRVRDNAWLLGKYLLFVDNMLQRYSALASLRDLKHLAIMTGWVPAKRVNELSFKLSRSGIPVYAEFRDPEPGDNPPTLMRNPPVVRFYQLVTRLHGVPGYFERDPTPLIAYSFALFFGLMNADFGYALIGVLAALFVLDRMVDDPESPTYREFKGMVLASNTVALILGILSGTIFGDVLQRFFGLNLPVLLPSILSPLDFIKLSLIIGLVHVNAAHVLAAIKFARERKRGDLLIELGLLTAEVFGIPYVLSAFFKYTVPVLGYLPPVAMLAGALCGVAMIVAGSFMSMGFLGAIMWLFQVTGLMGDVLSYVRLAGVGLATYYMALMFNFILELASSALVHVNPALSVVVAVPLAVIAHLVVAALSQLGAFVHSLRLCILEFLGKFYEGKGYEYNPFRIVGRTVVVSR